LSPIFARTDLVFVYCLFASVKFIYRHVNNTTSAFVGRDFVFMKSSTSDRIKGTFKEAKGKAKEEVGKATGDPDQRDRGTAEKVGRKVQRKIGDVKKVFGQ